MTTSRSEKTAAMRTLIDEAKALSAGRDGLGVSQWRSAFELALEIYGPTSTTTLFCENNLAAALLDLEVYPEAVRHYQGVVACHEWASSKSDNGDTLISIYQNLARAYSGCENFEQALATWMKATKLSRRLHGDAHKQTQFCERKVARALVLLHRYKEALPILRRQYQAAERERPNSRGTAYSARDLGYCLNSLERYADALHYLKAAHHILSERCQGNSDELGQIVGSLHWTKLRVQDRAEKAERERIERLELIRSTRIPADALEMLNLCGLSHLQFMQVLRRIRETYSAAENPNHLRVTRKASESRRRSFQTARLLRYNEVKAAGIGVGIDEEFIAADGDLRAVIMLGYHVE
ncbi:MAG TPA: tetratricopeptide repeat protein [Drouetiella sp.]